MKGLAVWHDREFVQVALNDVQQHGREHHAQDRVVVSEVVAQVLVGVDARDEPHQPARWPWPAMTIPDFAPNWARLSAGLGSSTGSARAAKACADLHRHLRPMREATNHVFLPSAAADTHWHLNSGLFASHPRASVDEQSV
jgi:hypothetical protein